VNELAVKDGKLDYGDPNAAARVILDRLGATYRSLWGGFSRF
jgi:hypothetical protein